MPSDLRKGPPRVVRAQAEAFAHKTITLWLPVLYFLISSVFFLRTYDSAQVKISMMQMGGLGLLTLWLCRLVEAGRTALSKDDLVCLSPFLAYTVVGVFSFIHAPYRMVSTDFFLRHMFYMSAALIAIYEFDDASVQRLFRWIVAAAWVAVIYGTIQYFDTRPGWFPEGIGKGIDPFIWREAFGRRIFSTYGNPNFYGDFLVIVFPIILTQWLKKRGWSLVVLMALLILNLLGTETKGAWLGFAMVCVFFGIVTLTRFQEQSRPYRAPILGSAALAALALVVYTGVQLRSHLTSINFRLFTWEATWEMIGTQPWRGSGLGAFPPLYPAFRRPPIFHIEGKSNTETDHAEDEYLDQFLDNGILGLGIFLWLVISTLFIGFRSLGQLTTTLSLKDGRPPPRAYDLMGLLVSFAGMLGHNFFDVSLRFVSSGVYLGLLSGLIVNVSRGRALYELHVRPAPAAGPEPEPGFWKTAAHFLIWPARLAAAGAVLYFAFLKDWSLLYRSAGLGGMFGEFAGLMGPLSNLTGPLAQGNPALGGELLQWWIGWGVFAACMIGLGYAMIRLCFLSENPVVPALVFVMLQPLYFFWGYFKADVHHNIAIALSKEQRWDAAIANYLMVDKLNGKFPASDCVMAKYFLANVFNDRFDMRKIYNPAWGDQNDVPADDYERALRWYDEVRKLSPNYVQSHHQIGTLHLRRAQWAMDAANHRPPEEVQHYLDLALNRFLLYRQVDPVFGPNYFRIAQVHMMRKEYDQAARAYEDYIAARACAVEPRLLRSGFLRNSLFAYQRYVQEDGLWVHRHPDPDQPQEAAEIWRNLGDARFLGNHLPEAEAAYKRALGFNPNLPAARQNLQVVYNKAQAEGRLRKLPFPAAMPGPGEPPFTGFEVIAR